MDTGDIRNLIESFNGPVKIKDVKTNNGLYPIVGASYEQDASGEEVLVLHKAERTLELDEALKQSKTVKARIEQGDTFMAHELLFSAYSRCECGAGLAYPKNIMDPMHYWQCADVLMGELEFSDKHSLLPFTMFEVLSESQPSAEGATTRP